MEIKLEDRYCINGTVQPPHGPSSDIFVHSMEFEGGVPLRMALIIIEFERRAYVAATPAELPREYFAQSKRWTDADLSD